MNALIDNVQIIQQKGAPAFAVIPYDQYRILCEGQAAAVYQLAPDEIPNEVINIMVDKHCSPAKAWRLHLGISQKEAAARLGITQAALSQMEKTRAPQKATLKKLAEAYGLHYEQLDF